MKVVNANNYKTVLKNFTEKPTATLILGDQSPGKDENCYWVDFLLSTECFLVSEIRLVPFHFAKALLFVAG